MKNTMRQRYVAEFIGTFGIVFAPVALSATGTLPSSDSGLMASAWVSGLSVLAMIYALGHISAAHFNPAVTLGFAIACRFPWRYVLPYLAAEFLGGITAAAVVALLLGGGYGAHIPASGLVAAAVGTEAVLTFFLMLVIISVATDKRVAGAVPGLAIGLTVVFDVLIGGPVSGGSMNPARSLGPALFAGGAAIANYWIYVVGPILGALVAARLYEAIRGSEKHAQGAPNDLYQALHDIEVKG
ncbi:MIP/aquaporin family protein [Chlorogloea sp. CCALA 695]|uniref:MIP/aquaporin family protein n=1 Tax=Chlorogloea sp. CCALA 695 TaxID=2107693 RepID=UPI001304B2EA|nr:aquaporin [Chlorogloea sp. CCALA 695]